MNYQWYPGHMTKARRMMQENIKLIDIMVELVDARIPLSSKNPDIDDLARNKARLIVLNKVDMADPEVTSGWEKYYQKKGFFVAKVNSRSGSGMKEVKALIETACKEKKERDTIINSIANRNREDQDMETELLLARNKWVIAHPDRKPLIDQGAYPGIIGDNKELFYQEKRYERFSSCIYSNWSANISFRKCKGAVRQVG